MSKSNLDRFDDMNNFHVERVLIRGHLEGQIAHAKDLFTRATNKTWRLVGRAICSLLAGLHSNGSNFCITTGIETIFMSKSIVSTRRRQPV